VGFIWIANRGFAAEDLSKYPVQNPVILSQTGIEILKVEEGPMNEEDLIEEEEEKEEVKKEEKENEPSGRENKTRPIFIELAASGVGRIVVDEELLPKGKEATSESSSTATTRKRIQGKTNNNL
jgi:hypothetical protein